MPGFPRVSVDKPREAAAHGEAGICAATCQLHRPVRDDAERLRQCLASISANRYGGDVEIIVADNGSRDHSVDVARAAGAKVVVLPQGQVSQLRAAGVAQATGDILAFVDADHTIDDGWITAAVEALTSPDIAVAGAEYLPPPCVNWVQRAYDRLRSHRRGIHDVEWLGGGNMAVRSKLFADAGGFDTSLETCEDVDLCNRFRAAGYRVVSDDRMRSIHFGDPTTLREVFFGELWRGRDNLRTTLRAPLTLRSVPSLAIPAASLLFMATTAVGAADPATTFANAPAAPPPSGERPKARPAASGIRAISAHNRQTGERASPRMSSWPQKPQKWSNGPATP